jgi:hypothetical protein
MATARAMNILIVHGVGSQAGRNYARQLQKNIGEEFDRAVSRLRLRDVNRRDGQAKHALRFEVASWASVTQKPEDALLDLMGLGGRWPLRRFNLTYQVRRQMVSLLGDVVAYGGGGPHNKVYKAIHGCLDDGARVLGNASADERNETGYAPLTLIGHSLGSVIASDYVWDNTRQAERPYYLAQHHLSLKNMLTLGSPLAIYALRDNPGADEHTLAESLDSPIQVDPEGGMWINIYDPHDPIAFPLQPIRSYDRAGVIDCLVRAGTWLTAWNPASHVGYWRSPDVAQVIGRKLALDWASLNSAKFAPRYEEEVENFRKDLKKR